MRPADATVRHMEDWRYMSAADLGRGIAAGEIDPVELTETFLSACAHHELTDRIYARLTPDRARAEALVAGDVELVLDVVIAAVADKIDDELI